MLAPIPFRHRPSCRRPAGGPAVAPALLLLQPAVYQTVTTSVWVATRKVGRSRMVSRFARNVDPAEPPCDEMHGGGEGRPGVGGRPPGRPPTDLELRFLKHLRQGHMRALDRARGSQEELEDLVLELIESGCSLRSIGDAM